MKKNLSSETKSNTIVSSSDKIKRVREFFNTTKLNKYNPDTLFKKYHDFMEATHDKKNMSEKSILELHDLGNEVMFALGLDTHQSLVENVSDEYRYLITEIVRRLEEEYGCTTATEKSLVEVIALSHIRILSFSKTMSAYGAGKVGVNKEINDYYRIVSKELDRSHRQLTSAIMTLRQIKIPHLSLNINAKTAFIAHNQQINEGQ